MLLPAFDKSKLFAKNFFKNSNLDDSGISLPVFPSRTNLKLHNISVSHKILTNLDLLKACSPDFIPVVVLKNCEPELSSILHSVYPPTLSAGGGGGEPPTKFKKGGGGLDRISIFRRGLLEKRK